MQLRHRLGRASAPVPAFIVAAFLSVAATLGPTAAGADVLSLDSCLAIAAHRSPQITAADREVEAARARLRQALALEPPTLAYDVGKLGTPVSPEEREASLRLSQGLPLPMQRSRAGRVARLEVALAEASRESRRLRLQADVTRAYRRLQADQATLRVLSGLRSTVADLEEATKVRLRAGGARYLDVLRARSERARLENDLVETERALRNDMHTLNTLMARRADEALEPADALAFVALGDTLPAILARARETRPGLRAARLSVERQQAATSLARSALLPAPELSLGLDRVPGVTAPGIGGSIALSLPFAPWTDRRARIQESEALRGAAQAGLDASERSLDLALRNAYQETTATAAQVASLERQLLPDVTDAIQSATRGYQFGQIDGLELFETLRTYRGVQLEHVRALLNYHLALTDLDTLE
ncbi:MAG: TolC family protein [Candidatus Eisenbacteria bacterium]|nr:TolC family protein [Candidatus Eisenbacteria bacterium]